MCLTWAYQAVQLQILGAATRSGWQTDGRPRIAESTRAV